VADSHVGIAEKCAYRQLAIAHQHLELQEVPSDRRASEVKRLAARIGHSPAKWNPREVPIGG
jgi:hypothetical protein